ncbi:MAG: PaaI family thioesterase [Deltaproteobacteria bacterium]|nr:PaaI family thioesterase [Deltaproteobacteria bacterium]MBI4373881.1 PaaI family thioesterase [Deltaproteobacteria bacterium]
MKKMPKNYRCPDKFGKLLGYRLLEMNRGKMAARATLTLREDHLSPAGRIHGGVISSFFDFACGAAVFSTMRHEDFCSTVELKVNYFRPLLVGDRLVCNSQVVFRGNKLAVVQASLDRGREKVAMASATFYIVSRT